HQTKKALQILQHERPGISFSSLRGIKDLVLKSSESAIPLLHMEWGEVVKGSTDIQEGSLHMWSLPENSSLIKELRTVGIVPKARGSIYHHRLHKFDWGNVRTSEL